MYIGYAFYEVDYIFKAQVNGGGGVAPYIYVCIVYSIYEFSVE